MARLVAEGGTVTNEVVDGVTLEDLLAGGPLEPPAVLELLAQVAAVVEQARARGVAIPDLQPTAVLLDAAQAEPRVVDLAPAVEAAVAPAAALQYVSPERILAHAVTARSDVYSLSALAYRCLTGGVPFPRGRGRAVLFWHLHAPRPRVTDVRGDLPAAVDGVFARGMAIDPSARHATASELVEDARRALSAPVKTHEQDAGPMKPMARGPIAPDGRGARAHPARSAGAMRRALVPLGAVVILAAAVVGYVVAGAPEGSPTLSSPANVGSLRLAVPTGWRPSTAPVATSMLRLGDPLVVAAPKRSGGMLIAGTATADASVEVLRQLRAQPPSGQLVSFGAVKARRYRAARAPAGAGRMTLYLAPTDHGVATVACVATTAGASSFPARCETVAASLHLTGGRFTAAGPSARQARHLARAFGRLNAARMAYRSQVRRARSRADQAAAARAVARAHTREASTLRSLDLTGLAGPGGRASLRGVERAAAGYQALAAAATRGRRRSYAKAREAVLAADATTRRAVAMLRVVGYAP